MQEICCRWVGVGVRAGGLGASAGGCTVFVFLFVFFFFFFCISYPLIFLIQLNPIFWACIKVKSKWLYFNTLEIYTIYVHNNFSVFAIFLYSSFSEEWIYISIYLCVRSTVYICETSLVRRECEVDHSCTQQMGARKKKTLVKRRSFIVLRASQFTMKISFKNFIYKNIFTQIERPASGYITTFSFILFSLHSQEVLYLRMMWLWVCVCFFSLNSSLIRVALVFISYAWLCYFCEDKCTRPC